MTSRVRQRYIKEISTGLVNGGVVLISTFMTAVASMGEGAGLGDIGSLTWSVIAATALMVTLKEWQGKLLGK